MAFVGDYSHEARYSQYCSFRMAKPELRRITPDKSLAPYRECRGVRSRRNRGTFEPRHFR